MRMKARMPARRARMPMTMPTIVPTRGLEVCAGGGGTGVEGAGVEETDLEGFVVDERVVGDEGRCVAEERAVERGVVVGLVSAALNRTIAVGCGAHASIVRLWTSPYVQVLQKSCVDKELHRCRLVSNEDFQGVGIANVPAHRSSRGPST